MNLRYLYIIMCIFSLLALPGCRDEEAVQTSEGTRTVTVNLGIAMSRADKDKDIGDSSTPKDMKVWIFNQDNTELVDYYEIKNPTFSGSDILNELVNTHEHVFELDNSVTMLNFYAVLNSESGTGLEDLGESSPVIDIQNATFTGLQDVAGDNQVPVYGTATVNVRDHKNSYPVTIETERAVSKLELFFTRESASSDLKINRITLENIPDKGLLAKEIAPTDIANYDKTETLFEDSNGKEITTDLPASESPVGDFSNHPDDFVQIDLSQAYLLENPNNNEWNPTTGSDYEYPEAAPSIENAYVLTVEYTLDGTGKTQEICLPEIKRNVWNKIFARVKGGVLYLSCTVADWEDGGSIDISYAGTYDGELTPISSARVSDNESNPAYAVVYGGGVDIPALSFTFKITQPIGATWTANLTNGSQFVLEGDASGIVVGEEDNEFTFIVRPNQEFSVDDIRETELYITVTTINGEHPEDQIGNGEQIINPDNTYPGTQTRIKIRQVSSEEWNGLQ